MGLVSVGGVELNPQLGRILSPAEEVSFDSTPTLDSQTVPIAAKLNGSSRCPVLSNFAIELI